MSQSDPDTVLKLLDALHADYPMLHKLIGDDYFDVMGCRYLKKYPPAENSIVGFGEHLSDFLKTEVPYTNVPSLAELVDFESALRQSINAADTDVMKPECLHSLAPDAWSQLAFRLPPSLIIIKLDWNVPQIWAALSSVNDVSGADVPEPVYKSGLWLVYRKMDRTTGWRSATPLEGAALESVYHGLTFSELCEELCNLVDDVESVPQIASTFVRTWVEQGLLSLRQ